MPGVFEGLALAPPSSPSNTEATGAATFAFAPGLMPPKENKPFFIDSAAAGTAPVGGTDLRLVKSQALGYELATGG